MQKTKNRTMITEIRNRNVFFYKMESDNDRNQQLLKNEHNIYI